MGAFKKGQRFEPPFGDSRETLSDLERSDESITNPGRAFRRGQKLDLPMCEADMGKDPIRPMRGGDAGNSTLRRK